MYANLRKFLELLEKEGELKRVNELVSTYLEIAEITDRECKSENGGKALLFENNSTPFPVLTNMMGSDRRIRLALGCENLEQLGNRIMEMFSEVTSPKKSIFDKLKILPLAGKVSKWMPKYIKGYGECQQMVISGEDVDLNLLPILKCAPYDGGKFVTLPLVNTVSPITGVRNVGMYRMQVIDNNTTGMHWHIHKTGERHYSEYKKLGKKMAVSVCLGGDPAYTYSATAPLPEGIDEYMLSGFIRNRSVELVKCITNDLYVPSDCDFVIEGYVDPEEEKFWEGPFADHTGFYSLEDYYPKFHVTCITHRRDAIYPATIVGIPPMEDAYIAKATEAIFLAPIRLVMQPEITDMWLPEEGVAHNLAFINIKKSYIGQAQKVAHSMWGAGQMMFNKFLIITSLKKDKSIRNLEDIKSLIKYIDIDRDVIISQGTLDVLDHTSDITGFGGKLSIDATKKDFTTLTTFSSQKELPSSIDRQFADRGWATLFVFCNREVEFFDYSKDIIDNYGVHGLKFLIIMDEKCRELSVNEKIWLLCSNCDAKRDSRIHGGVLILDARIKAGGVNGYSRRWPNTSPTISQKIDVLNSGNSAEYVVKD